MSSTNLSLYIPHVFLNLNESFIAGVFESLRIGRVDRVDFVRKSDRYGKPYNAAYVHFAEWYTGPAVENFVERVKNPAKEARIVYEDPWYWIVLENNGNKTEKPVTFLPIAPGLSEIVLSPEYNDEINCMISELYNGNMDLSCEFIDKESASLKERNEQLYKDNVALQRTLSEFRLKLADLQLKDLTNTVNSSVLISENIDLKQEIKNLKDLLRQNLEIGTA